MQSPEQNSKDSVKRYKGETQYKFAAKLPRVGFPCLELEVISEEPHNAGRDMVTSKNTRRYPQSEVACDGSQFVLPFETSEPHLLLLKRVNEYLANLKNAQGEGREFEMPLSIIEELDHSDLPLLESLM